MVAYDTLGSIVLPACEMAVLIELVATSAGAPSDMIPMRIGTWRDLTLVATRDRDRWLGRVFFETRNTRRIVVELRRLLKGGLFGDLDGNSIEVRDGFDWFRASAHMPRGELTIQLMNIRTHLFDWAADIQRAHGHPQSHNRMADLSLDYESAVVLLEGLERVAAATAETPLEERPT